MLRRADLHESNHQLESRVREIRLPGSEGGAILISRPYPYPAISQSAIPHLLSAISFEPLARMTDHLVVH